MNFRKWFRAFNAGENEILELLRRHVELSLQASTLVQKVVDCIMAGDHAAAYVNYLEIDKAETDADHVQRELVDKLSTGVFFSNLGTDLMSLAENVDGVADSAKSSAKIITQRRLEPSELAPIREKVSEHLAVTVRAVTSLQDAIGSLAGKKEELLMFCRAVEEYEEAADIIKDSLTEQIYALNVSTLSVLQLSDFVRMVDNISDYAEDATDVLYVVISKGYS
ncbi:MAG: DUF47 family protein [Conexivisphaerales archaeon]